MLNLLSTILTLSALGAFAALVLYYVVQRFNVEEDPRIDEVESMLPGANCGGCGFAGCRGFAVATVEQNDISNLNCPVGGGDMMASIAEYLGKAAAVAMAQTATLRCGGCKAKRATNNIYDGAKSCSVLSSLYVGENSCATGCVGLGDCVVSCKFDAIYIGEESGLAQVDADLCVACGACVSACPRSLIELRKRWPKNRAIYVSCNSHEKGAKVMQSCKAGCIGCGKCVKVCTFGAISVENNLAYIDSVACKLCRKCVAECPTKAISMVNFNPTSAAAGASGSGASGSNGSGATN